jgi:hypothetical protein
MIQSIKSYLSLRWVENLFTDSVSGKQVALYEDCYGKRYMKDSRWGLFKVERNEV